MNLMWFIEPPCCNIVPEITRCVKLSRLDLLFFPNKNKHVILSSASTCKIQLDGKKKINKSVCNVYTVSTGNLKMHIKISKVSILMTQFFFGAECVNGRASRVGKILKKQLSRAFILAKHVPLCFSSTHGDSDFKPIGCVNT